MKFKCISVCLLLACCITFAGQRVETVKIVKPDTIMTIKPDTIKTMKVDTIVSIKMDTIFSLRLDTLKIVKAFKDTSVFIKADTIRLQGKSIRLKKK